MSHFSEWVARGGPFRDSMPTASRLMGRTWNVTAGTCLSSRSTHRFAAPIAPRLMPVGRIPSPNLFDSLSNCLKRSRTRDASRMQPVFSKSSWLRSRALVLNWARWSSSSRRASPSTHGSLKSSSQPCGSTTPARSSASPGGTGGLVYYRLHGSPRMYYSTYDDAYLDKLAKELVTAAAVRPTWCIFDNTALGAATANALRVMERLRVV
jgi:hypothetical protein